MQFNTSTKDITPLIEQIALNYVNNHYDITAMSAEEYLKAFFEAQKEISNSWGKYRLS